MFAINSIMGNIVFNNKTVFMQALSIARGRKIVEIKEELEAETFMIDGLQGMIFTKDYKYFTLK